MPNVDGAVSGPEDCSHMQSGEVAAEPNPLQEYPDVQVIAQRTVADANDAVVDEAAGSRFPMSWVLGNLDAVSPRDMKVEVLWASLWLVVQPCCGPKQATVLISWSPLQFEGNKHHYHILSYIE